MDIAGSVALVTGSNRGLGREFVRQLQARGARRIYATARRPDSVRAAGVDVLGLDVTDPAQAGRAADQAPDVTLLINNAGISTEQPLITGELDRIRLEIDTHFYGTLHVVRAFASVLGANGGGAILNVLSTLSWLTSAGEGAYAAAKAAQWSLTDSIRLELAAQGTLVAGLHVGAIDTEMMAAWKIPKNDPAAVVAAALDGLQAGRTEILADAAAADAKASLVRDPAERYAELLRASAG